MESQAIERAEGIRVDHIPGESGVWIFILGDMTVFGVLFAIFMQSRGQDQALFADAQEALNQNWGAINTLLLLLSSWMVVLGLHAARRGWSATCASLLMAAVTCGVGFVIVKYFEWGEKFAAGINLTTNDFFMYYFMLTGLHLVHLLVGLAVLTYMLFVVRRGGGAPSALGLLEGGGCFWHMVDLLWIALFPLIYLVK